MLFQSTLLALAASSGLASAHMSRETRHTKREEGVFHADVKTHMRERLQAHHITESDSARIAGLRGEGGVEKRATSAKIENSAVSYLANIGFGTGGNDYQLIIDTGSSNTWAKKFKLTSDAKSTGESFSVTYGSGSVSGTEYKDSITLASGLKITNQGVGRGTSSSGFSGVDGILGVGPEDLTSGTTSGGAEIPTVMQTAKSQGKIAKNVLGCFFAPTSSQDNENGLITYGGIATGKTTSAITYQNKLTSGQASYYWGLSIKSNLGSGAKQGIVDTGTTLVYLPSDWFKSYKSSIPSAAIDSSSGLLRFPKSSLSSVPTISFTIGGKAFKLNKYSQLVEQGLYSTFGLSSNYYYSWIGNSGSSSGLSFILGQKFLERYYSVFDTANSRIGFASTSHSSPTSVP